MEKEDLQPKPPDQTADARKAKRLLARVVFFFLLINGAILYKVLQSPEPTYQGKTVTEWISTIGVVEKPDPQVVNVFGPDAWPSLVRAIGNQDSALKKVYLKFWQKLSPPTRKKLRRFWPINAFTLRFNASMWLMELGPDAKEAVPALIELALHAQNLEIRRSAIHALSFAGAESPDALSALIEVLKEPEITVNGTLILDDTTSFAVARFGSLAKPAVPLLVKSIRSRRNGKPLNEILALGLIGPEAHEAVPTLVEQLQLRDPLLQANALGALSDIGPRAAAAANLRPKPK